ncbi:hypothetical protein NRK68_34115 (plasmid) [Streptomyces yangpuensis]|uniref:Uncharacterized protein n=1 Tax=Streptomyces yangpuensis TaxID=1648182 RepID=A0ABY5Q799_9ACTN|nr:hypothetical protein [Streptomyces yangpuensis]UUY52317.1 hypothetical protein NRK68_34115 [Streptomyces yangpuensis]
MADELRERGQLVASLGSSLRSGRNSLGTVPKLLEDLLLDGGWKDFVTQLGDHVTYADDDFETFVCALPLKGLGASLDLVELIIGDRNDLLAEFYKVASRRDGRPRKTDDNVLSSPDEEAALPSPRKGRQAGNSKESAIRRLGRERPDLLAKVTAGELSPHRASIQAGWRKETATIPLEDPERIAQVLVRRLERSGAAAVEAALRRLLATEDEG